VGSNQGRGCAVNAASFITPFQIKIQRTIQMAHRIKSMITVRDLQTPLQARSLELRNPLYQDNMVWKVLPTASVTNGCSQIFSRTRDSTGILDDIAQAVGPPTAMCVLGDNVIGVASWEQIPLAEQYQAVTEGAGAFVASNMHYLRLHGPDAAAVLNMLTPRNIYKLPPGRAMFTLFTTPTGTVDEEAIVLRTGDEEYLVSCGCGTLRYRQLQYQGTKTGRSHAGPGAYR